MDPQAAWVDFLYAIHDRDLHTAAGIAQDLIDWYNKGGFHPPAAANRTLPNAARAKDILISFRRLYRLAEEICN